MKVLMVQPFADGGIAHYAHNLASALAGRGEEVVLFTAGGYEFPGGNGYRPEARMFRWAARAQRRWPWLGTETAWPSLLRRVLKLAEYPLNVMECAAVARRAGVQVLHVQTVNLTELAFILALKPLVRRVVYTIHNVNPRHGRLRPHHRLLYRLTYSLCDALIIHSAAGKAQVSDLFGVPPARLHVIPHGDYKFFLREDGPSPREARRALGVPEGARTVLFFGAIRPNKGLDVLLEAMPAVMKAVPGAMLMIAGEACEPYVPYRALIERGGLAGSVLEKLAYVPNEEVGLWFAAADVVALPYREISQSGVLQVAYAFGRPVVASSVGGFAEAVEDGGNGYLVPPGDAGRLARAIIAVLGDGEAGRRMGERSRRLSDTLYAWEAIAASTALVYRGAAPGAGEGRE